MILLLFISLLSLISSEGDDADYFEFQKSSSSTTIPTFETTFPSSPTIFTNSDDTIFTIPSTNPTIMTTYPSTNPTLITDSSSIPPKIITDSSSTPKFITYLSSTNDKSLISDSSINENNKSYSTSTPDESLISDSTEIIEKSSEIKESNIFRTEPSINSVKNSGILLTEFQTEIESSSKSIYTDTSTNRNSYSTEFTEEKYSINSGSIESESTTGINNKNDISTDKQTENPNYSSNTIYSDYSSDFDTDTNLTNSEIIESESTNDILNKKNDISTDKQTESPNYSSNTIYLDNSSDIFKEENLTNSEIIESESNEIYNNTSKDKQTENPNYSSSNTIYTEYTSDMFKEENLTNSEIIESESIEINNNTSKDKQTENPNYSSNTIYSEYSSDTFKEENLTNSEIIESESTEIYNNNSQNKQEENPTYSSNTIYLEHHSDIDKDTNPTNSEIIESESTNEMSTYTNTSQDKQEENQNYSSNTIYSEYHSDIYTNTNSTNLEITEFESTYAKDNNNDNSTGEREEIPNNLTSTIYPEYSSDIFKAENSNPAIIESEWTNDNGTSTNKEAENPNYFSNTTYLEYPSDIDKDTNATNSLIIESESTNEKNNENETTTNKQEDIIVLSTDTFYSPSDIDKDTYTNNSEIVDSESANENNTSINEQTESPNYFSNTTYLIYPSDIDIDININSTNLEIIESESTNETNNEKDTPTDKQEDNSYSSSKSIYLEYPSDTDINKDENPTNSEIAESESQKEEDKTNNTSTNKQEEIPFYSTNKIYPEYTTNGMNNNTEPIPEHQEATSIAKSTTHITNRVEHFFFELFIVQVRLIENKIRIFATVSIKIERAINITISVYLYKTSNIRMLQENQVNLTFTLAPQEPGKIFELSQDVPQDNNDRIESVDKVVIIPKKTTEFEINYLNNDERILDTSENEKMINNNEMPNFANTNYNNYQVYNYHIESSTTGCNFDLISSEQIQESKQEIYLNFSEPWNSDHKLTSHCILSSQYGKKIPCSIGANIDQPYNLNSYAGNSTGHIYTITPNQKDKEFQLVCKYNSYTNLKKKSRSISKGIIAMIIILSILFVGAISFVVGWIIRKKKVIPKSVKYFNDSSVYDSNQNINDSYINDV